MGGRIYDPRLGRFLQADPFIQAPLNSQNYNRYAYVLNNPMSYTDPSGYISIGDLNPFKTKRLLRSIAKVPILNAAVQIGIGIACNGAAAACLAAYNGLQSYAVTGSLGAGLRSAAISYATASAFKAIGGKFTKTKGFFAENGLGHIGAHALVGGISSTLQGGKFGHGFFSAGITKGLTPHFEGIGGADYEVGAYNVAEATIAGILGGSISHVSGGKFANGAATAAMGNLFNNQASRKRVQAQREARAKRLQRLSGGSFESIDALANSMRPGELRFGIRPLGNEAGYPIWLVNSIGGDLTNLSLVHEHIVYMDENGQLQNIGFTGSERGVAQDSNFEGRIDSYDWGPIQQVDLGNINFHSLDFQSSNYHMITNNCQDYCSFIRKQL